MKFESINLKTEAFLKVALFCFSLQVGACVDQELQGLMTSEPAAVTVKMDFLKRPLPDIPLPIDLATRHDDTSATGLRVNASMVAPTGFEIRLREKIAQLDGWGVFQPITIPFTDAIDVDSILAGHRDLDYDISNDVFYVINIDPNSPKYGQIEPLDMGNGNYPVVLEERNNYWKNDSKVDSLSLAFEEDNEDINQNGILDSGEDKDADGLLDVPNYYSGMSPEPSDLAARTDALMTFYERQTNTVILRLMEPLEEKTKYAVVVTKRLLDENGESVGSPFDFIHHTAQHQDLSVLGEVLPEGMGLDDVAFAFSYTTQSIHSNMIAVREGLYGEGVQSHLSEEFPAEIASLENLRDEEFFPDMQIPTLMYGEDWSGLLPVIGVAFLNHVAGSANTEFATEASKYADFHVIGHYNSPQLYRTVDDGGNAVDFNDQAWPEDLTTIPAEAVSEKVYFTLTVPRKEISARGEGKPAPLIVFGHGYGGNRFDHFVSGQYLVRQGFAVLTIDGPSHGLNTSGDDKALAETIFGSAGLKNTVEAIFLDRAKDFDFDGVKDSGADFWTSYLFHTRDVVRQFALDYMQAIRIVKSFDGVRTWPMDVNGDGENELAGDFNADGEVDVGLDSPIYMTGGSLGGIMSMIMGGIEPHIEAVAPIVGGGGYQDIGSRSKQTGVPAGFFLQGVIGPLYAGTVDLATKEMKVDTIFAELNKEIEHNLGTIQNVEPGDLFLVENITNGEKGCGVVSESGEVRTGVESDRGDATRIVVLRNTEILAGTKCLYDGGEEIGRVETFGEAANSLNENFDAGSQLVSLGHGLGRRRAHPDLRRMMGIGQLVLDPGDPVVYARNLQQEPIEYPSTGEKTGSHALVVNTLGDNSVPVASGITYSRGWFDRLQKQRSTFWKASKSSSH